MGQDTLFSTKSTLRFSGNLLCLEPPAIMGILNITPDSFSDGGELDSIEKIVTRAGLLLEEGASILDIGGYSTRPGATDISTDEELERVIPAIQAIHETYPNAILSIDTFRSSIASEAIQAGAQMINDVSGGNIDDEMFPTVAALGVPYVLMHMKGTPQNMKELAVYDNILDEMMEYFDEKISTLRSLGVTDIIVDPGLGFAKNIGQNYYLLKNIGYFKSLGLPLLIGVSRKSMIFKRLGIHPGDAVNGTTVLNTHALFSGAGILRVHDVREAAECIKLVQELNSA